MAKYRLIAVKLWDDPDFEEYSSDAKLVFLFLITNHACNDCGLYPITFKRISLATGLTVNKVSEAISSLRNVTYDKESRCVFVHNFMRYNQSGGNPTLLEKGLVRDYKQTNTELWNLFVDEYPQYITILNKTSSKPQENKPLGNPLPTVVKPLISQDKISKDKKESPLLSKLTSIPSWPISDKRTSEYLSEKLTKYPLTIVEQAVEEFCDAKITQPLSDSPLRQLTTYISNRKKWQDERSPTKELPKGCDKCSQGAIGSGFCDCPDGIELKRRLKERANANA